MTHNAARPLLPASWISLIKEIIHSLSHNLQCQDDQALCFRVGISACITISWYRNIRLREVNMSNHIYNLQLSVCICALLKGINLLAIIFPYKKWHLMPLLSDGWSQNPYEKLMSKHSQMIVMAELWFQCINKQNEFFMIIIFFFLWFSNY